MGKKTSHSLSPYSPINSKFWLMKTFIFTVALVVGFTAFAQEVPPDSKGFVRVYDLQGEKFANGKIQSFSDSALLLKGEQQIDPQDIGIIKTKRSTGHNVLVGTIIGAVMTGGIMAATADPDDWVFSYTAGEGYLMGTIIGAPVGAFWGWISSLLKESRTFIIDGDQQKWQDFQDSMGGNKNSPG